MVQDKDNLKIVPQERAPQEWEAPLPSKEPREKRTPSLPNRSKVDELFKKNQLGFDQATGFLGGPSRRQGVKLALWSCLAVMIDTLVLISVSCIFMAVFSYLMKSSGSAQFLFFAQIFVVVGWIYMVSLRTFMGSSVGEWTCDLRLGQPHERLRASYALRVALRSTLILGTGVITLPLLSLIFKKDLAGLVSGLRLFSLK